jgi:Skp family chaperone for outer membrane proteins
MTPKQGTIIAAFVAILAAAGGAVWYFFFNDSDSSSTTETAAQAPASAPAAPTAKGPLPTPVVLVIDKSAILRQSKAGQQIASQIRAFADQAKAELEPQGRALQAEATALKSQGASMTPEQRQARAAAFENKQAAFQRVAGIKQNRLQMALANANHEMEKTVGPILKQVMADRHANIVVDKQVVIFSTDNGFDVTAEVVQKLDAALPSVKVELPAENAVSPDAGATP